MFIDFRKAVKGAITAGIFTLAACSGSNPGILSPVNNFVTQPLGHPGTITTQSASLPCSSPVKGLEITASSLSIVQGETAQFTACTTFSGLYTITASADGIVSFASPVNPTEPAGSTVYSATIAVTALHPGSVMLTVSDKKGDKVNISVTVKAVGPLGLSCSPSGIEVGSSTSCTYSNSNYVGDYTASSSSSTCVTSSPSNGTFSVNDSAAEDCSIALTPTSGPESPAYATIHFVGPIQFSCDLTSRLIGSTVSCSYENPNYSGTFSARASSSSGQCAVTAPSNGTVQVTDSVAEACTIEVSANDANEAPATVVLTFTDLIVR
jgi:hypothetical protein